MAAEPDEQRSLREAGCAQVHAGLVPARREARRRPLALAPAFVMVVIGVEAHDARAPHHRRRAGDALQAQLA